MAKIIYVDESGIEKGLHVGPDRPEIVVGRVKTCDLVTANLTVSRRHASITFENGRFVLRDLGSANGTFFRKQRVTEVVLEPREPVFVGSFPIFLELEDSDLNVRVSTSPGVAPAPPAHIVPPPKPEPPRPRPPAVEPVKPMPIEIELPPEVEPPKVEPPKVEPPKVEPAPVEPPKVESAVPERERSVPNAWKADWKPAVAAMGKEPSGLRPIPPRPVVQSVPAGPGAVGIEPGQHPLRVDELEELLARERRETERLAEALYTAESGLVDMKSSMAMIEEENRSMAVSLDTLDLENAERMRDMEALRDERDRFDLEASSLRSEVEALRRMAPAGGGAELDEARREIEDLKLSTRGYLKRIGKLLEEKERQVPGGVQAPSAAVTLVEEINELAATALAGLDAVAGTLADAGAPGCADAVSEATLMVAETVRTVARLKKDVQELGHQLKDSFNNN